MIKQTALLLAAAAASCALGGCATTVSGTPSVDTSAGSRPTSATALEKASEQSLLSTPAFRCSGTVKVDGHSIVSDVHFGDNGSDATLTVDGYTVRVRAIGSTLYINGSAKYWRHEAKLAGADVTTTSNVVRMYAAKWGQTDSSNSDFASLTGMVDRNKLFDNPSEIADIYRAGRPAIIDGVRATSLIDTHDHSVLWVRATGTPFPVEATLPGHGALRFTAMGVPFHVPTPPGDQVVQLPS